MKNGIAFSNGPMYHIIGMHQRFFGHQTKIEIMQRIQ